MKILLNRLHLQFVWNIYQDCLLGHKEQKAILKNLRFNLGQTAREQKSSSEGNKTDMIFLENTFNFVIAKLTEATDKHIIIVYCPTSPKIKNGQINYDDPDQSKIAVLEKICHEKGVKFVNMGPSFQDFFEKTTRFPRGFANTVPGEGHFNRDGHHLVASAIHNAIGQNAYAFHSN